MAAPAPVLPAGLRVPDFQLAVGRHGCRRQQLAVPAEGDAKDRLAMPAQGTHFTAHPCIPDFHGSIVTSRGEVFPVGAVSHAPNTGGMAGKAEDLVATGHPPHPHGLIDPVPSETPTIPAQSRPMPSSLAVHRVAHKG